MKNTTIALLFLALSAICPFTAYAQVEEIFVTDLSWFIRFEPGGGAGACYGSTFGDCLSVQPGTVDFPAMLKTLESAERKDPPAYGQFQIAIRRMGEDGVKTFVLQDGSIIRDILFALESKWEPQFPGSRIQEIRESYPIIPKQ